LIFPVLGTAVFSRRNFRLSVFLISRNGLQPRAICSAKWVGRSVNTALNVTYGQLIRSDLILPVIGCQADKARLKRTRLMAWANPRS
jgi:hypothetical protein